MPNETQTNVPDDVVLHIERILPGGDGMARRKDGCVVFVPRTAPGDEIEVTYTEQRKQWRRGRLERLAQPGPERREAPCSYYDVCGGCQLQHLEYEAQLAAKSSIIVDCLKRLGGIETVDVEVEASPNQFAYRNRISLVARWSGSDVAAGYHALDAPDEVIDIAVCPLAEDSINAVWASLREALHDVASEGAERVEARLTLRANVSGGVGLAIEGIKPEGELFERISALDGINAVWWLDPRGRVAAASGAEQLNDEWGGHEIPLVGTAFLQVNRAASRLLDDYVIAQCAGASGQRIVDAYCGFGLRALEIARTGATVVGIDVDRRSVKTAVRLTKQAGVSARFIAAAVERALVAELPADTIVLNPPRRGVDRGSLEALTKQAPGRIIYVSCDPATLARDLKILTPHFELAACRGFDLFPQTAHVETVATLVHRE